MGKIGLASYSVRVRERYGREPLLLGHLPPNHRLWEEFRLFVADLHRRHVNDRVSQNVVVVSQHNDEDAHAIWGLVDAGTYGRKKKVVDSDTFEENYTVAKNDSVLQPFYFQLYAPDESRQALLLLQREGNIGIVTVLFELFRAFFEKRNPSLKLQMHAHVPERVITYLTQGSLTQVEYRSYDIPRTLEEKVGLGENREREFRVRTVIQATDKRRSIPFTEPLRRMLGAALKRANDESRVAVRADHVVEQEEISLTFRYGGNERTLNLTRPDSIFPYVDVSDLVEIDEENGHPKPESIHAAAVALRNEILARIGMSDAQ